MGAVKEFFVNFWANEYVQSTVDAIIKIGISAILSGIIGFEREHSHRPAGFRTHILVAVGSTLVMLTSVSMFNTYEGLTNLDPARLGAQVISGIGFLGAGTILREGFTVKGLTTAASLWAVCCIGLAVGLGYYTGAFVSTIMIYITLNVLKKFISRGNTGKTIYIEAEEITSVASNIGTIVRKAGASLHTLEILYAEEETHKRRRHAVVLKALVFTKDEGGLIIITDALRELDGVNDLYVD